jgi:calcineurin-like phosphoesterase family protein
LGDFAFASFARIKELLFRLNGSFHFIIGNHDREFQGTNIHELTSDGLLDSIQPYLEIKAGGNLIVLSHYAHRIWNKSHRGSIHCFGHSHGHMPPFGLSVDVGVDCHEITKEYRPVSLDEVFKYMSKRVGEVVDHHGAK